MPSNKELIKLIKQGIDTQENYEKLYKQNRGFIYQVIRGRVHGIHECDDLMQQSFIALTRAVDYYKPELEETNFLQILKYCIWNEVRNLTSEISAHMQSKIIDYKRTYDKLYNELGYKPKTYQIMLEMNIDLKKLEEIRLAYRSISPLSLNAPINEEENATLLDLYSNNAADEQDFDCNIESAELRQALDVALTRLPCEQKEIIEKRYYKGLMLRQIGEELQVSNERVRQIENQALRKLRQDTKLKKQVIDTEISNYINVSIKGFNRTHISATEQAVLRREELRQRLLRQRGD